MSEQVYRMKLVIPSQEIDLGEYRTESLTDLLQDLQSEVWNDKAFGKKVNTRVVVCRSHEKVGDKAPALSPEVTDSERRDLWVEKRKPNIAWDGQRWAVIYVTSCFESMSDCFPDDYLSEECKAALSSASYYRFGRGATLSEAIDGAMKLDEAIYGTPRMDTAGETE